ncbi:hypothetical protein D3C80_1441810 [compost metagenome]
MLEQVGEARTADRLVLGPHMIPDVHRHDRRLVVLMDDQGQAVRQHHLGEGDVHIRQGRQGGGGRPVLDGGRRGGRRSGVSGGGQQADGGPAQKGQAAGGDGHEVPQCDIAMAGTVTALRRQKPTCPKFNPPQKAVTRLPDRNFVLRRTPIIGRNMRQPQTQPQIHAQTHHF